MIAFISCANGTSNNTDSSFNSWKITANETSKTISGVYGKKIYAVRFNPTSAVISKANNRTISTNNGVRSIGENENTASTIIEVEENTDYFHSSMPIITPKDLGLTVNKDTDNSRAIARTSTTRTVGDTKSIYVDDEVETYAAKIGTVRAVGTYCTVWTIEGYYGNGNKQISTDDAVALAAAFDELYQYITTVSGNESDKIYKFTNEENADLTDLTDTKVNLVFFDICTSGIMGYFYSRDYFDLNGQTPLEDVSILEKSNKGKYLYIDTECVKQYMGSSFATIAHEFQHMIDFNQKTIIRKVTQESFTEEMCAMLCEDMMSNKLKSMCESFDALNDSPLGRLQGFNGSYFSTGLKHWNVTSEDYAMSYTFGAWLARNYGGAEFLRKLVHSNSVGLNSIAEITGESIDNLFQYFFEALVFQNSSTHSLNKNAAETLTCNGYTYPMTSINLWSSDFSNTVNSEIVTGPLIFNASQKIDLQPGGFLITYLGEATSYSLTINATSSSSGEVVYIMAENQNNIPAVWSFK